MGNEHSSRTTRRIGVALLVASTACGGQVLAQNEVSLEEVVVTAQKRAQNIQDVPLSITALGGEKLDIITAAGADVRALSARIPSLQIESSFGRTFPRFYIRGLGNTDFDLNASQPVSLVYDGVVLENPFLKGYPMFDMERVEVLRGPQGTLFGRNSPSGIVKFESRKPTREFDGYASAAFGSFSQLDFDAAIGGPVNDSLAWRFSVLHQSRDDWVKNVGPGDDMEGYEETAGRLQALWNPNSDFDALLNVHFRDLDGTARVFRANIIQQGSDDFVPGFDRDRANTNSRNDQEVQELGMVATLNFDMGEATVTSITAYEDVNVPISIGDVDGGTPTGPGFIPFQSTTSGGGNLEQFTQEVRIASNAGDGPSWQAGVFFFNEKLAIEQFAYDDTGTVQLAQAVQNQETDAFGVFGHVEYPLTDMFTFAGGVRYSDDQKDYFAARPFSFIGPLSRQTASPSDSQVSWDLSGTYTVSDDTSVYGRVARGFRAPSIQGRVLFANDITVGGSETNLSFEAGMKSELLQNRMRLNLAAFYYTVDDQQLTAVGGTANTAILLNADETVGFGFESDLEFAVNENFLVTGGLSYNNTEINDPTISVPVCGSPCTVLDPLNASGRAIIDGNPLPQAPEWIANTTLRYSIPTGDNSEFYFYTDWAYRSEVNFFLYESKEFRDESLVEGGLKVGYSHNRGKYDVAIYVRNLTDDESLTGGIDFNNLTGFVNEPRVWGVAFSTRFR